MTWKHRNLSLGEALDFLEIPRDQLPPLNKARSYGEACKMLEDIKDQARKQRRALAKRYHPDISSGDQAQAERMITINNLVDAIIKAELPRPRPATRVTFVWSGSTGSTDSSYFSF
jgi:hypothetical protein